MSSDAYQSVPLTLELTYDAEADASYLYLRKLQPNEKVAASLTAGEDVILDLDSENRLVGIEILRASGHLPNDLLEKFGIEKNRVDLTTRPRIEID